MSPGAIDAGRHNQGSGPLGNVMSGLWGAPRVDPQLGEVGLLSHPTPLSWVVKRWLHFFTTARGHYWAAFLQLQLPSPDFATIPALDVCLGVARSLPSCCPFMCPHSLLVSFSPEHTLCMCVCTLSCFGPVWVFVTPWIVARQVPLSTGLSSKNIGVGCHALLQGVFLALGLNLSLLQLLR